ncbi:hypothetical protein E5D57_003175 [Metarhizium anisopliae]|nr:hypothetical protein E5D57_003175 [Metarhizium anisopliae]
MPIKVDPKAHQAPLTPTGTTLSTPALALETAKQDKGKQVAAPDPPKAAAPEAKKALPAPTVT